MNEPPFTHPAQDPAIGATQTRRVGPAPSPLPLRLVDLRAAAAYFGCTHWHLRRLVATGQIPVVRMPNPRTLDARPGRRLLVDIRDLDALIERWKERINADVNQVEPPGGSAK